MITAIKKNKADPGGTASERVTLGCSGKASLARSDLSRALEKGKGLVYGTHGI